MNTEQLKLSGMGEAEIQEASSVVQHSVGTSAYLYGVDYSLDKFKQELGSIVKHIKSRARTPVGAKSTENR